MRGPSAPHARAGVPFATGYPGLSSRSDGCRHVLRGALVDCSPGSWAPSRYSSPPAPRREASRATAPMGRRSRPGSRRFRTRRHPFPDRAARFRRPCSATASRTSLPGVRLHRAPLARAPESLTAESLELRGFQTEHRLFEALGAGLGGLDGHAVRVLAGTPARQLCDFQPVLVIPVLGPNPPASSGLPQGRPWDSTCTPTRSHRAGSRRVRPRPRDAARLVTRRRAGDHDQAGPPRGEPGVRLRQLRVEDEVPIGPSSLAPQYAPARIAQSVGVGVAAGSPPRTAPLRATSIAARNASGLFFVMWCTSMAGMLAHAATKGQGAALRRG